MCCMQPAEQVREASFCGYAQYSRSACRSNSLRYGPIGASTSSHRSHFRRQQVMQIDVVLPAPRLREKQRDSGLLCSWVHLDRHGGIPGRRRFLLSLQYCSFHLYLGTVYIMCLRVTSHRQLHTPVVGPEMDCPGIFNRSTGKFVSSLPAQTACTVSICRNAEVLSHGVIAKRERPLLKCE
jgi:hypothetical protein